MNTPSLVPLVNTETPSHILRAVPIEKGPGRLFEISDEKHLLNPMVDNKLSTDQFVVDLQFLVSRLCADRTEIRCTAPPRPSRQCRIEHLAHAEMCPADLNHSR